MAIREWGLGLVANPVRAIRWPSPGAGRDRRLTPEEQNSLLVACDTHSNPRLGWMVRLALASGVRAGESQRLRRSDVNLGRSNANSPDTKNNETRTVPLTREAIDVLSAALSNPIRPIDTDLLFFGEPGKDGQRHGYEYKPEWRRIKEAVGLT